MVSVASLNDRDAEECQAFLEDRPDATLYHSMKYRRLLARVLACRDEYLVARRDGRVVGMLPMLAAAGKWGVVLNSLPFFGSHGGTIAADPEAAGALWDEVSVRIGDIGVAAATIIENPFGVGPKLSSRLVPSFRDHRLSQVTPLAGGEDFATTMLARIDGSARRNIRKAEASGIRVAVDNGAINFLARCHGANMQEIAGTPKPNEFFAAFPDIFTAHRDYDIYVATADGVPIAALLLFYYGRFVEYFIPVTDSAHRERQPMAAILYNAMCDAAARGFRLWNWGGTWCSQTGVYRFKRKWGAEEAKYGYSVFISRPDLLDVPPHEIQAAYPYFYVYPFGAAKQPGIEA